MKKLRIVSLMVGAFIMLSSSAFAQVCGLCKLSLVNSPEGRNIAAAFNHGILFLLAMPYLIAGGIAFVIRPILREKDGGKK